MLLWAEGWELEQVSALLDDKYAVATLGAGCSFEAGRHFGSCFRASTSNLSTFEIPAFTPDSQITVGLAFRAEDWPASIAWPLISFKKSSVEAVGLYIERTGASTYLLYVLSDTTILGYSKNLPANGEWQFLEFQVTVDAATGAFELRMNGESILEASAVNTDAVGDGDVDSVELNLEADGSNEVDLDDIYILDSTGAEAQYTSFLGDIAIDALLPADDAQQEWARSTGSDNYALVDDPADAATPDADYVEDAGTGTEDLYTLPRLSLPCDVLAVFIQSRRWLASAGSETLSYRHRQMKREEPQPASQELASDTVAETSATWFGELVTTDPLTSERFCVDDLNEGNLGVEKA